MGKASYIFNPEIETMPREKMELLQLKRLKETVRRCYENVSFHRENMDRAGVTPDDIQTLEDLQQLPFMVKSDLRENYPFKLFAVDMSQVVRIHGSSGTKGKPTIVGYTKNDIENWAEVVARAVCAAGGRPGDMFHNAYGYGLFTGGLGLHYGVEKMGGTVVPVSGGNTARQITLIQDFQPRGISATPSYTLNIVEEMKKLGLDPRKTNLAYGIFGAEPWTEEMRAQLEEELDIKAIDIYGLSEVIGPGVSIECYEAQDGLHIAEDHFLPEVIDPETGEVLPYGEEGELVFTSLTKEAFPVIRYRTGDIASLNPEKCKCGRTTIRMSRIKGRIDDMFIVRGVNVFPTEIESVLLAVDELAPHYQVVLSREGVMDSCEVHCEVTTEFYRKMSASNEETVQLTEMVRNHLKEALGISVGLKLCKPRTLPRSEGKAIRIIDKREKVS